ncbi:hypothetical protein EZV62_024965 [Acer yangbiense]|uniref:Major facilitator superfamily (MFS) profile domain-containing protein n=1 Tax=Acer yangbiense TaxID=1000413 RepID=A0A5C7GWL3_9ROSI|nr:hypothetical protein EZV62_024965 [Acer yangbiense]
MDNSDAPFMIENGDHQLITTQKPSKKVVEVAERFAFYGLAGNLITYLTNVLHEPTATAAKNVNTWMGVSAIFPIFGAYIADSYLGRFKSILLASVTYFMGMVLLSLAVSVIPLEYREAVFFTALYILAVGEGGHKPCVQTFAADQFDENNPQEREAKSSFFNWWYLGIVAAASAAILVVIYIQVVLLATETTDPLLFLQKPSSSPRNPFHSFDLETKAWHGLYDLRLDPNMFFSTIAFSDDNHLILVGLTGVPESVSSVKMWEVKDKSLEELREIGEMPEEVLEKLKGSRSCEVSSVTVTSDNVGWAAGFGLLAGALAVSLAMFLVGIKRYKRENPVGSPFTTVAQVLVAAVRKWRVSETRGGHGICYGDEMSSSSSIDPGHKFAESYEIQEFDRTNQLRFLDKAMITDDVDYSSKTKNPWRLCSLNQVEEVKLVVRLIPIWLGCLMFSAVLAQVTTFYTKQGSTMVRSIGPNFQIPPASLLSISGLMILVTIPVYDQIFVPLARKFTGHRSGVTMLQRIVVGLQELFYDQMPEALRSLGAAAYISVVGVGSFLNSALISIVQVITAKNGYIWLGDNLNRAYLDRFYWLLAGLSAVNFCVYLWIANGFVYKKVVEDHEIIKEENEFEEF